MLINKLIDIAMRKKLRACAVDRFWTTSLLRKRIGTATFLLLFCGVPPVYGGTVPSEILSQLTAHKVPTSAVSMVVREIGNDTPVLEINPEEARNPASTLKLVTTFIALAVLGPQHRWKTEFFTDVRIEKGVLNGNLYVKGHGDPYLVVEDFWKSLGKLKDAGLTVINGDLIVDDSHFSVPPIDPGAFDGEPLRLYNVQPRATLVNFKAFDFTFSPHRDGQQVIIEAEPDIAGLQLTNRLRQKNTRCTGYHRGIRMLTSPSGNANEVVFSGSFPSGCRQYTLKRTAMDSKSYLRGMFGKYWAHWGGSISGGVKSATVPNTLKPLVVSTSRPLVEIIRPLNKWSNNVMARLLVYALAGAKYPPPLTREQGVEVMLDYLRAQKINTDGLIIDNGSGLSRKSRVSANFMTALLHHAFAHPLMPEYVSSLSLNGIDGTTRRRFRSGEERGKMHLKTGRLDGVAAIAGYVLAQSGKTYSVTMLGNYRNIHHGAGIAIQNALLAWVYKL
ncbi:MAG: D-alanyl-D-alanine carboxypeptidase/D-alanyl-D-alanine endopeptidase [Gammaproteobacteria bacterium]